MKHKRIFKTPNYREACEKFTKCKDLGTSYLTYDYTTREYTVELTRETKTVADMMRQFLLDIKFNYDLVEEEIDALDYADSAIKTLQDMNII